VRPDYSQGFRKFIFETVYGYEWWLQSYPSEQTLYLLERREPLRSKSLAVLAESSGCHFLRAIQGLAIGFESNLAEVRSRFAKQVVEEALRRNQNALLT